MRYPDIILASASPRRRELLQLITPSFEIRPADVDETVPEGMKGREYCEYIARKKGEAVALCHHDALVISADTAVIVDDVILGKPSDREEAFKMLSMLSGRTHSVVTGCCLFYKGKSVTFSEETKVTFYHLDDGEITAYIDTLDPFDKAGGYGIQTKGVLLVKGIEGDYNNVVGLPVSRLYREISEFLNNFT